MLWTFFSYFTHQKGFIGDESSVLIQALMGCKIFIVRRICNWGFSFVYFFYCSCFVEVFLNVIFVYQPVEITL